MERQNFIFKKKTYVCGVYSVIKLFTNIQYAWCGEGILLNIYILRFPGEMGYI